MNPQVRIVGEARCLAPPPSTELQRRLAGCTATVQSAHRSGWGVWVRFDVIAVADDATGRQTRRRQDGLDVLIFPGEYEAL
jgi:hypothetical protein